MLNESRLKSHDWGNAWPFNRHELHSICNLSSNMDYSTRTCHASFSPLYKRSCSLSCCHYKALKFYAVCAIVSSCSIASKFLIFNLQWFLCNSLPALLSWSPALLSLSSALPSLSPALLSLSSALPSLSSALLFMSSALLSLSSFLALLVVCLDLYVVSLAFTIDSDREMF